jgi:dCMP deaminase
MDMDGSLKMNNDRLSWSDYFMQLVDAISQRSTCDRGKPGCVFVKNNQILTTGYAGSPPGFPHCSEVGHELEVRFPVDPKADLANVDIFTHVCLESNYSVHCIRTIHCEQNAIIQAARRGISLDGSTLYVTMTPCRTCAMMLISVGVVKVIAKKLYHKSDESIEMFKLANIPLVHLDQTVQGY